MKTVILSAFAAMSLITVAAHAEGEGNGDPFPFRVGGAVTVVQPAGSASAFAGAPRGLSVLQQASREVETAQAPSNGLHR